MFILFQRNYFVKDEKLLLQCVVANTGLSLGHINRWKTLHKKDNVLLYNNSYHFDPTDYNSCIDLCVAQLFYETTKNVDVDSVWI